MQCLRDKINIRAVERVLKMAKFCSSTEDDVTPSLVIYIDGVNQNSSVNWEEVLSKFIVYLKSLRGVLVFSSREGLYDNCLTPSTKEKFQVLRIGEFEIEDVKRILALPLNEFRKINPEVLSALRNPRLLSVALKGLSSCDQGKINFRYWKELSVPRLLYEHSVHNFSVSYGASSKRVLFSRLIQSAELVKFKIYKDLKSETGFFHDAGCGIRVELEEEVVWASEGLFYEINDGDFDNVSISEKGLWFSLGVSYVYTLRRLRGVDSVGSKVSEIFDPILAFDRTGDILFNSIVYAAVSGGNDEEILKWLIFKLFFVQNLPEVNLTPLGACFKKYPSVAVGVLSLFCRYNGFVENERRIIDSICGIRDHVMVSAELTGFLCSMLRAFNLKSTLVTSGRIKDKREVDRWCAHVVNAFNEMSEDERYIVKKEFYEEEDINITRALNLSVDLISGIPLANFTSSIVWSYIAESFDPGRFIKNRLDNLVMLNQVDWHDTRKALRKEVNRLIPHFKTSHLIRGLRFVLEGTGCSEDYIFSRNSLGEGQSPGVLNKDGVKKRYDVPMALDPGFRNNEIEHPEYLKFLKLDEKQKRSRVFHAYDGEKFFAFLARFYPACARQFLKSYFSFASLSVEERDSWELRRMIPFSSCLPLTDVEYILGALYDVFSGSSKRDILFDIDELFALAFPHLNNDQQLIWLEKIGGECLFPEKLLKYIKYPLSEGFWRSFEGKSSLQGDRDSIFVYLASECESEFPHFFRELVAAGMISSDQNIQDSCIRFAALRKDNMLLNIFVCNLQVLLESASNENSFRNQYIQWAALAAGEKHILDMKTVFSLMTFHLYDDFCDVFSEDGIVEVFENFKGCLAFFMNESYEESSLVKKILGVDGFNFALARFSALYKVEKKIFPKLYSGYPFGVSVSVLNSFSGRMISAFQNLDEEYLYDVACEITRMSLAGFDTPRDLCVKLARVIENPKVRVDLLRISRITPLGKNPFNVEYVIKPTGVNSLVSCLWCVPSNEGIQAFRYEVFEKNLSDWGIFQHVFSALDNGREDELKIVAYSLIETKIPSLICKALAICGYMVEGEWVDNIFARLAPLKGIIEQKYEIYFDMYLKNKWARYWFNKLGAADDKYDYWRYVALFLLVVDHRYFLWNRHVDLSSLSMKFKCTLDDQLMRILKDIKKTRQGLFLGCKPPGDRFFILVDY